MAVLIGGCVTLIADSRAISISSARTCANIARAASPCTSNARLETSRQSAIDPRSPTGSIDLTYDNTYYASPAPGFLSPTLAPVSGTWRREQAP